MYLIYFFNYLLGEGLFNKKEDKICTNSTLINYNIFNSFVWIFVQTDAEDAVLNKKRSTKAEVKYKKRQRFAKVEPAIDEQFQTSRLLGELIDKLENAMMILKYFSDIEIEILIVLINVYR